LVEQDDSSTSTLHAGSSSLNRSRNSSFRQLGSEEEPQRNAPEDLTPSDAQANLNRGYVTDMLGGPSTAAAASTGSPATGWSQGMPTSLAAAAAAAADIEDGECLESDDELGGSVLDGLCSDSSMVAGSGGWGSLPTLGTTCLTGDIASPVVPVHSDRNGDEDGPSKQLNGLSAPVAATAAAAGATSNAASAAAAASVAAVTTCEENFWGQVPVANEFHLSGPKASISILMKRSSSCQLLMLPASTATEAVMGGTIKRSKSNGAMNVTIADAVESCQSSSSCSRRDHLAAPESAAHAPASTKEKEVTAISAKCPAQDAIAAGSSKQGGSLPQPPRSQYKGVVWDQLSSTWHSCIKVLGKQHSLGRCVMSAYVMVG
jgi:hypothetical protein